MEIAREYRLLRRLHITNSPLFIDMSKRPLSLHIVEDEEAFDNTEGALVEDITTTALTPHVDWLWEDGALLLTRVTDPSETLVAVFSRFNDGRAYHCPECRTPVTVGCDHNAA